ncbi:Tet(A)/Tet(B)/Tet(C) family tetracycline efflux MFS transporter [Achromobacter ruhlandii]|uniref:Tet(A)/Tet(B)/Tet(C) family tetracycline efflux MFS transporter n=1 Tax=Achromobacter ruhlandii TaxID=72557 RepID=UPI0006BFA6BB|nr:Tet(A)/Tet(B)/Tet(C) family tetracycline efflux MFS transporter [Achromobacter ruhlandii]AMG47193.1 Tet(A)/Tet(B)/Tet(C) family tetracycline efflux MFS transporter [Achromobacter xylosoxidans]CUI49579.1 Tetracycline resistance protein%2C class C [Achromobacter ruhlandii]CUJ62431.1 Tetracycline resistance protein%2C class C [Achromobacter ruhlandii]CUJ97976.1 Tetracycline resistance protein%2C class C [Achromobacter ruhlandii]
MPDRAIALLLFIVTLDAAGIGLIMPVLPGLLDQLSDPASTPAHYGLLLSLYALAQCVAGPVLGALSDRYGRRPVLLASLAGAAVDYVVMAAAPALWVLYPGRILAGITGATGAVAAASIADNGDPSRRARSFGQLSACFGLGLIVGPALGGLVGLAGARMPFVAAALANGVACLLALAWLPESRHGERPPWSWRTLNPVAGLRQALSGKGLGGLLWVFLVMQVAGQVPGSLWVLYGQDRFHWDAAAVGLSLAGFGALHALMQATLPGPLSARLGERGTLAVGMAADASGYVLLAWATHNWMVAPLMLLLAAGGVGAPALQALLSARAGAGSQGQLQGAMNSLASAAAIGGPLAFTALYAASLGGWTGWPWVAGAALYLLCVPVLVRPDPRGDAAAQAR